jgi:MFS family permease
MRHLFKDKNFLRLCLAAFFMSSCLQLVWVVMPFIVKALGGSDTEVGLCFTGQMGVYVVFCILVSNIIDKFKPKKILLLGAAAEVFIVFGLLATVWYGGSSAIFPSPIMRLILLMSLTGVITAFFWPVMMGWISTGHEGAALTKRFGFYNTTWSSANMLLPIIGGYLMEINYSLPLAAAALMSILCFLTASTTTCISETPKPQENNLPDSVCQEFPQKSRQFLWMSRVSLLATFICVGIFRSQLGILYKFELGFPESAYGWSVSLMCLFNIVIFWMMGKSHYWHYKKGLFAAAQALIIICMLMIIFSASLLLQLLASGLAGICYSVAYSSHQYYGVSGGKKRSGLMAVHETIIGAGFAAGSLIGGILSDAFGRRSPYWFASAVIIAAGLIQLLLWFAGAPTARQRGFRI